MSSQRLLDYGHPQQRTTDKLSIIGIPIVEIREGLVILMVGCVCGEMREIVWGRCLSSFLVAVGS